MITIDKLCYISRLRYENAAEKFAFAVITLIICVMSRSMVIAGIVLAVTGILTVWKGGIPLFRYLHFLSVPLAFLFLSTLAILVNVKQTTRFICYKNRKLVLNRKHVWRILCPAINPDCTCCCILPVFPFSEYTNA